MRWSLRARAHSRRRRAVRSPMADDIADVHGEVALRACDKAWKTTVAHEAVRRRAAHAAMAGCGGHLSAARHVVADCAIDGVELLLGGRSNVSSAARASQIQVKESARMRTASIRARTPHPLCIPPCIHCTLIHCTVTPARSRPSPPLRRRSRSSSGVGCSPSMAAARNAPSSRPSGSARRRR